MTNQMPRKKITVLKVLVAFIPIILFIIATGWDMQLSHPRYNVFKLVFDSIIMGLMCMLCGAGFGPLSFAIYLIIQGLGKVSDICGFIGVIVGVFAGNILGFFGMYILAIEGNTEYGYKMTSYLGIAYIIIAAIILIINMIGYANKE
ncbi:hypothetical protein [Butyrivibrio proteoclasticus]|uniref:hypothetical protein n=1 Tax=Butyrivibrio proteoclasticus TaxID=43305 RepID=UPI00047C898E|nr:hypothetical protein [Butyrivibrio proteoclasticus]